MNGRARFAWWSALRSARCAQPMWSAADRDPAGMGTAFGLDASFDAVPSGADSSATANAPEPAADAVAAPTVTPFEQRLVRRSRL